MRKEYMQAWFHALRLRTLPLAVSGVIVGVSLSWFHASVHWETSIWILLTTLFLQILSNLANDLGDSQKGTDNENRLGPMRSVQSGLISFKQMKNGIVFFVALSLLSGVMSIYSAFSREDSSIILNDALIFLGLGVFAIAAAIKYTVGKSAYGYRGLGDLFVLIFFGWISVAGTYFLNVGSINMSVFLPATTMGLFAVAVLNLNNMRDIQNDKDSGKMTIAVRLGIIRAKQYHLSILILGFASCIIYIISNYKDFYQLLFLLILVPMMIDMARIKRITDLRKLDPFLKKQALKTFLYAILFSLGLVLSLM